MTAELAPSLKIQTAGTMPESDRPPALVGDLIDGGEMLVLGAARAVGKSWWGMGLSLMLARGHGQFMGKLAVLRPARVLYCHGELDPWAAYDRWQKLAGGEPMPSCLWESFDLWRIRLVRQRVTTGADTVTEFQDAILDRRLEATITAEGIEVLVLDPWKVFYAGQENDNDQAEAALSKLRDLQLRYGLTIIALHHFGKAGDPEDLWRGATRLADWASTRVTLQAHYKADQAKKQGMTRHQARRYADVTILRRSGRSPEDFSVAWDAETGHWDRWLAPQEASANQRVALTTEDVAAKCPASGWESIGEATAALGVAEGTARQLLERAKLEGLLEEFSGPRRARAFRPHSTPRLRN